ncbi:caspase family protein [Sinanaerobacter chloroacetimidivorans]|uniref:Caspase family protein n=1 Tax=Sinanaerobacter chloroacetimidivorans TaxID=2818044 RepID=A0A8J7W2P4_9FIRM|nr:caspase family protein [Sinanaerobacter chloroacetimidivorans]MBR0599777.1 caspase family protein [Sinanaerobacter chloroacetimidivorans]
MKKALIIGIDEYPTAPLNGCINDANAVAELLRTNGDGSPNFDVSLNLNVGTKAEFLELLDDLFSGNADATLLYFSGHGSESGHLVTPDYRGRDLGVSMTDVLGYANRSKCNNKIIILDCCFSGKFGELQVTNSSESILGEGITIMTASSRDEVSMESNGQGLFTSLFLQGLRGSAADITGRITPAGIYAFIDQSLGAWQQRPVFKTNISHFLSIRDIEPRVPKSILRKLGQYFDSPSDEYKLDPSFEFTNNPAIEHEVIEPYAKDENVNIFKELQLYESVGLIEPVDEEHMYFAAMKSKSCKLTALGLHYWKLAKDSRF